MFSFVPGIVLNAIHIVMTKIWSAFCLGKIHSLVRDKNINELIIKCSEKYFNRILNAAVEKAQIKIIIINIY